MREEKQIFTKARSFVAREETSDFGAKYDSPGRDAPSRRRPQRRVVAVEHPALEAGPAHNRRTVGCLLQRRHAHAHPAARRALIPDVLDDKLHVASAGSVDGWLKQAAVPAPEEPAEAAGAGEDAAAIGDRHAAVRDARAEGVRAALWWVGKERRTLSKVDSVQRLTFIFIVIIVQKKAADLTQIILFVSSWISLTWACITALATTSNIQEVIRGIMANDVASAFIIAKIRDRRNSCFILVFSRRRIDENALLQRSVRLRHFPSHDVVMWPRMLSPTSRG